MELIKQVLQFDSKTGALSFTKAPNFEQPSDSDKNNSYVVVVQAKDEGGLTDDQTITVNITDDNDAPVITSSNSATSKENQTSTSAVVSATDEEGDTPLYLISGGADSALFTLGVGSGILSFKSARDFETMTDANKDGKYEVEVTVIDGNGGTASQLITVTVTDENDAPVISGGPTASYSVQENVSLVATLPVSDQDKADVLTYSLTGPDAALFTVNASTKELSFKTAPNYESPADAGGDNVYDIILTVSDSKLNAVQAIAVTVTPVNEAPDIAGGTTIALSVPENTSSIGLTVTDPDSGDVPVLTLSGPEAGAFNVVGNTLQFKNIPNFEQPGADANDIGADGKYEVVVTATDSGKLTDVQTITISIADVNDAPVITSNGGGDSATISVAENTNGNLTTVVASDEDALPSKDVLTYSISGGDDQSFFSISPSSGELSFVSSPNFEAKSDKNGDNAYVVEVTVSDGQGGTDVQTITVNVTDANDAPEITSNGGGATASVSVDENTTAVTTVIAVDQDKDSLTYTISGGADKGSFAIDTKSGVLSFVSAPDFENPASAGKSNSYEVVVQSSDGKGGTDTQTITVNVADVNTPVISSSNLASLNENTKAVTTVVATDDDKDTMTYSIIGGDDSSFFTINAVSGKVDFKSAPNFEAPLDKNGDNVYLLEVQAMDKDKNADTQMLTISVQNVNEDPVISSNGGGDTAAVSVPENTKAVTTVMAFDVDGNSLTYSISGGADSASFSIDSKTGALSFINAPNFEDAKDVGANNGYEVIVQVSDGNGKSDTQTITANVADVNENPTITSNGGGDNATVSIDEAGPVVVTTVTVSDPDAPANVMTYSLGGADFAAFQMKGNVVEFKSAPDFETKNSYVVEVTVNDGKGGFDVQTITVNVNDVNLPSITTSPTFSVQEPATAVGVIGSSDDESDTPTYSIVGGDDASLFTIDKVTGALSFIGATDFETPLDKNKDNKYQLSVAVTDIDGSTTQGVTVTVTNLNEAPSITTSASFSVVENTTAVGTVGASDVDVPTNFTYSLTGGADAASFSINASTGALVFTKAPDFELAKDSDKNNVYEVTVQVSDGALTASQAVSVTVTNGNDAPIIFSNGGGVNANVNAAENQTAVTTVQAFDIDGDTATFAITGGADSSFFAIDKNTGALTFVSAPNFESKKDAGGDGVYEVVVQAADGKGGVDSQNISVTVSDVNDAPIITSNGGGVSANVTMVENGPVVVTTVTQTDEDAPANVMTYSLSGTDAGFFQMKSNVIEFKASPNFETQSKYVVAVTVDDGKGGSDVQTITVSVTDVNEVPTFGCNGLECAREQAGCRIRFGLRRR